MFALLLVSCVIDAAHFRELSAEVSTGDRDQDGHAGTDAGGEDCDDLDPTIYAGAEETWENGVTDNDCDGEREEVQGEFGAQALTGESAGGDAGRRLDLLDDVDGDGVGEILVGAWTEASLFESGGAAYLVMGFTEGSLSDAPAIRPSGAGWYLSSALAGAPDLDGDGVPDLVVGGFGFEDATGAVWLMSGQALAEGDLSVPQDAFAMVSGARAGDYAGSDAEVLGDVTGDGVPDLSVSAQLVSAGGYDFAGMVGLFDPTTLGDATLEDAEIAIYGTYSEAYIGSHVMNAGDQDDDGIDDYMITSESGLLAAIVPGGPDAPALEDDALFRLTATDPDVAESAEVRIVGDVDGDGHRDLAEVPLVIGESVAPQVRIFTALSGAPNRVTDTPTAVIDVGEGSFVFDVADAGDLDGDGSAEVLVPVAEYGSLVAPLVAIHFGSTLGYDTTIDVLDTPLVSICVRPLSKLGYRARVGQDVSGDGQPDIVLGGGSDDQGGADAGAVVTLPLPQ